MNLDLKEISFKDLKESPYFVLGAYMLGIVAFIALIVYSILHVFNFKTELVSVRNEYASHVQEIATLEELRAQSEKAEEKLAVYKEVLPDSLGDAFLLSEDFDGICKNFGLKVVKFDTPIQNSSDTKETVLNFTVEGTFTNVVLFMQYISTMKQIHRIDSISLTTAEAGVYNAALSVAVLSQDGATGIIEPEAAQ